MFIPKSLLSLFTINKETVDSLRLEVATLRGKNEILERELTSTKIMSDWLRMRHNQLEAERVKLLERAYPGLSLPAPEIVNISRKIKDGFDMQALFEDMGDPGEKSKDFVS